jgi:hypothetical protein
LSTGSKLVSFLPSNPTPNSICGVEQLPKSAPEGDAVTVAVEEEIVTVAEGGEPTLTVTALVLVAAGLVTVTVTVTAV